MWAKGLLIYNTEDPVGLSINIHGTVAEAWKSYIDTYEVASEISLLNTEMELRNMTYTNAQDFPDFISHLHTKWSNATALGAKIDDKSFRMIILNSLSCSWDPIVATLYTTQSFCEAINQLMTHWTRISHDRTNSSQSTTSALQTPSNTRCDHPRGQNQHLVCTNPNCSRRGHTIEFCYWPGGGKAGQFPEGFGKRGGARGLVNTSSTPSQTSANAATDTAGNNGNKTKVFALAVITEMDNNTPQTSNDISTPETHHATNTHHILTLLDSGASDHCIVRKDAFSKYTPFTPPHQGNSAGKGSTFDIDGTGTAEMMAMVEGIPSKIVLGDALHTPQLWSNLVSVLKLVSRGFKVSFEEKVATVRNGNGTIVLEAAKMNGLYVIPAETATPFIHAVQSKHKAVTFDVWHRRLGHIGMEVLRRMIKEKLVDSLNVVGNTEMEGMCEDCIFGKHTTHPFNDQIPAKTAPLQRVYINIWGPAPVLSNVGCTRRSGESNGPRKETNGQELIEQS